VSPDLAGFVTPTGRYVCAGEADLREAVRACTTLADAADLYDGLAAVHPAGPVAAGYRIGQVMAGLDALDTGRLGALFREVFDARRAQQPQL
jgi:hypothetical protein